MAEVVPPPSAADADASDPDVAPTGSEQPAKKRRKDGDVSIERRIVMFPDHGLELKKDDKGEDSLWCNFCRVWVRVARGAKALKDHCEGYVIKPEDVEKQRPCDIYKTRDRTGKDQYRRLTPHVLRFRAQQDELAAAKRAAEHAAAGQALGAATQATAVAPAAPPARAPPAVVVQAPRLLQTTLMTASRVAEAIASFLRFLVLIMAMLNVPLEKLGKPQWQALLMQLNPFLGRVATRDPTNLRRKYLTEAFTKYHGELREVVRKRKIVLIVDEKADRRRSNEYIVNICCYLRDYDGNRKKYLLRNRL
eukprot:Hpha_TRINITY_DN16462_c2_g1::TRINITY_DN16462_c2_g1_i1::g.161903::m.161903